MNLGSLTFKGGHVSGHYTVQNGRFPFTWPNRSRFKQKKPKFRTSKFLSRNRVYHLHKSVPLTEKRPRKPETVIKDRFDRYIFRCFVAPGNFTRERPVNSCSMYIFGKWRAPSVSQILLKKKGKLLVKRKSIADLQNGGNF